VGDAGRVVAGIQHDQHVGVAVLPLAGGDQARDDVTDLLGGHRRDIRTGRQPQRIQQRRPRGAAGLQRGHH
jgi:hypothetical protein